jgi:lipopolysaccharide transport system permease protein
MADDNKWDLVIKPQKSLFHFDLKTLWRYRDLIVLFVRRDFVSVYKQTVLGPLWHLVQPLLTTLTMTIVFGRMAGIATDGLPQVLFYLSGLVCWFYFSNCLTKTSDTFMANSHIFGKVYFPRLVVPISIVISNVIAWVIQLILFLGFYFYYMFFVAVTTVTVNEKVLDAAGNPVLHNGKEAFVKVSKDVPVDLVPGYEIAIVPLLVIIIGLLGLGFGVIVSSLTTKYRDLKFLVRFGVQLFMYASPIIYPLSEVEKGGTIYYFLIANPMTHVIEAFRHAFFGVGQFSWMGIGYSFVFGVVIFVVGTMLFNRVDKTFMDTV